MKIEIDLKEILEDEFGDMESLGESVQRQIVDNLTNTISKGILKKVDDSMSVLIANKVEEFANEQLPDLFSEVIDSEYHIVDRWGERTEKSTTMRKQLVKVLTEQMVYKKTSYNSDKNYFTANVDAVMADKMKEFKELFDTHVNEAFTKEALEYALIKMKSKLKID